MLGRIGTTQMSRNFLADLGRNQVAMARLQHQQATGKKLDSPADDPVGIGISLALRQDQAAVASWQTNIGDSMDWLRVTDSALQNEVEVIHRARELAVRGANGALGQEGRDKIADEIDQLAKQAAGIGNSTLAGRYIFNGTAVNVAPFQEAPPGAAGALDTGLLTRDIGQSQTMSVNITGDRFQGPPGGPTIFQTLTNLSTALRAGNVTTVGGQSLTDLDSQLTNTLSLLGEVGAKTNRLELQQSRFAIDAVARNEELSQIEDADMSKVIMDLSMHENVLKASLSVGGRVLQPSLVDFLR